MIYYLDDVVTYTDGAALESSFLKWAGYDNKQEQLYLVYLSDPQDIRVYFNVPRTMFDELVDSDSPGAYHNAHIRGRFSTRVLDGFANVWEPLFENPADEVESKDDFVTVGYVDEGGVHFKVDADQNEAVHLSVNESFSASANVNANAVNIFTGFKTYRVEFTIGSEVGSISVFATCVTDAVDNAVRTLGNLNVAYEITGVNKV